MKAPGAALIWCPFGSSDEAKSAASQLVDEQLVACANIVPHITSVFRYAGKVETAPEVAVLFKTEAKLLDRAISRLSELHPYETPAICGWYADSAAPGTLDWLAELAPEAKR